MSLDARTKRASKRVMRRIIGVSAAAVALALAIGVAASQRDTPDRERFTAFAVSLGGPRTAAGTAQVDITITRWSSQGERERLIHALTTEGPTEMLETLQDLRPVGRIQFDGGLGYDLHYAHQIKGEDGGRRIFIATDRPISFWEAVNRPRLFDYPFTFIEMHLDENGEGEGKLSLAAKLTASQDGRFIYLENYDTQPVMLNQVRAH